jgi:malonate transporter and related proteins
MAPVATTLAVLFGLIALGWAIRRFGWVDDSLWRPAERLTYIVLFPSLLVRSLANAQLGELPALRIAAALAGAILLMTLLLQLLRRAATQDGAAYASVVQGSIRFNSYIALGLVVGARRADLLPLAAICIIALVPLVNAISVVVHAQYGTDGSGRGVLREIARNPLIIACAVGIVLSATGIGLAPVADRMLDVLGQASLGIALLAVGAGLSLDSVRGRTREIVLSTVLKLLLMPTLTALLLWLFDIRGAPAAVAMVFQAAPTATSSYVLARQMGGDPDLMAGIVTVQTIFAALTLPVALLLYPF